MKEVLKKIASSLRALGFRGSGQLYRKREGDFVFVINFQGSKWGDRFFVNLGAQPVFIPAEGNADLTKLKEYECVFRNRVGEDWPWRMSDELFVRLETAVLSAQDAFFENAKTLPAALETDGPHDLLKKFSDEATQVRAILHLARAAVWLGHIETAQKLISLGKELASARADTYRTELDNVLGEKTKNLPS